MTIAQTIGDGQQTSFKLEHFLGTKDVHVQVYSNKTGGAVRPHIQRNDKNTVTLTFENPPEQDECRVIIQD